jgi:hypothetical protein
VSKQGQHNNDDHDYDKSKGPNNPDKSVPIITGTPKKQETYRQQAIRHEDLGKRAQAAPKEWNEDTRDKPTIENSKRARDSDITGGRSGSDSNAGMNARGE